MDSDNTLYTVFLNLIYQHLHPSTAIKVTGNNETPRKRCKNINGPSTVRQLSCMLIFLAKTFPFQAGIVNFSTGYSVSRVDNAINRHSHGDSVILLM